jgi:hypothetical protein
MKVTKNVVPSLDFLIPNTPSLYRAFNMLPVRRLRTRFLVGWGARPRKTPCGDHGMDLLKICSPFSHVRLSRPKRLLDCLLDLGETINMLALK